MPISPKKYVGVLMRRTWKETCAKTLDWSSFSKGFLRLLILGLTGLILWNWQGIEIIKDEIPKVGSGLLAIIVCGIALFLFNLLFVVPYKITSHYYDKTKIMKAEIVALKELVRSKLQIELHQDDPNYFPPPRVVENGDVTLETQYAYIKILNNGGETIKNVEAYCHKLKNTSGYASGTINCRLAGGSSHYNRFLNPGEPCFIPIVRFDIQRDKDKNILFKEFQVSIPSKCQNITKPGAGFFIQVLFVGEPVGSITKNYTFGESNGKLCLLETEYES